MTMLPSVSHFGRRRFGYGLTLDSPEQLFGYVSLFNAAYKKNASLGPRGLSPLSVPCRVKYYRNPQPTPACSKT